MSVVSHIATQRTDHGVPHAMSCRLLSVSESWFYKWRNRQPTATERRREELDLKVRIVFETSVGAPTVPPEYALGCGPTASRSPKRPSPRRWPARAW